VWPTEILPRRLLSILAVLGVFAAMAGCSSQSAIFLDTQSNHLRNRKVLFVDSVPQPPLSEERHRAIIDSMELRVLKLPYIGSGITRQRFQQITEGNFKARNDYQLYADTLSSVGISDRELGVAIAAAAGADLLFNVQAFYVPCAYCQDGNSAYLVSQFIEPATGRLLLRIDLHVHPASSDQAVAESFLDMEEETLDELQRILTPRFQMERFRNLSRLRSRNDTPG